MVSIIDYGQSRKVFGGIMIRACVGRLGRRALSYVRRLGPRALILVYHRVADTGVDPWQLSVSPRHFAEHLAILRKYWNPFGLKELAETQQRGRIPDRSAVITFDDGCSHHTHTLTPLI